MTHEELLAKIDANGTKYDGNTGVTAEVVTCPHRNDKALRAVVELHKPLDNLIAEFCSHCTEMSGKDIYTLYPCLTIQAIEEELG
jgi:hypothetical protein